MPSTEIDRENWSTRRAFLFASIGCAVGLGNLWRFPYITGENGGGAFIIIYLLCIVLFAAPLLMAEITIGRLGKKSAVATMRDFVQTKKISPLWMSIGWLAILIPALGLSYYSIVAGWSLAYMAMSASGAFAGHNRRTICRSFQCTVRRPARHFILACDFYGDDHIHRC